MFFAIKQLEEEEYEAILKIVLQNSYFFHVENILLGKFSFYLLKDNISNNTSKMFSNVSGRKL